MNFKRFNGSTWETVRHKRYGSGTDSLTAFPAMIQASGEPLTDYTIYGNTIQNGTPTPEAPVDVVGCGVRTENLFDGEVEQGTFNMDTGDEFPSDMRVRTTFGSSLALGTYTIDADGVEGVVVYAYTQDNTSAFDIDSSEVAWQTLPYTFNLSDTRYVRFAFRKNSSDPEISISDISNIMLNSGSTALPYEPYGYKIPIACGGETNNIYLGQAETTRGIRKLVLDGTENWEMGVYGSHNGFLSYAPRNQKGTTNCICSHYKTEYANKNNTIYFIAQPANGRFIIFDDRFASATDFKSYLAAQYAAGTPVTVWYVLAEPETGIVNEPLHKIGGYADTISFAQAGVTIPTFDGDNTISFGTTVQPSAMSATFKGWHPVQGAKQYDGNDWR